MTLWDGSALANFCIGICVTADFRWPGIRTRCMLATLLLWGWLWPFPCAARADHRRIPSPAHLQQIWQSLEADPSRVARIENIAIEKPDARFILKKGRLYLFKALPRHSFVAVYLGKGSFEHFPSDSLERQQLKRLYGKTTVKLPFNRLVLVGTDSTVLRLQQEVNFGSEKIPRQVKEALRYAGRYLEAGQEEHLPLPLVQALLTGRLSGYFYAHFSQVEFEPFFYEINPFSREPIRFQRRDHSSTVRYLREIVTQYRPPSPHWSDHVAEVNQLDALSYRMEVEIEENLHFRAQIWFSGVLGPSPLPWMHFWLFPQINVQQVRDSLGRPLNFWKGTGSSLLWIALPDSIREQRKLVCQIELTSEDLLERRGQWFFLRSTSLWYPRHRFDDRAQFEMVFRTPAKWTFVAVGQRLDSALVDGVLQTHWRTEQPVPGVSFNFGYFRSHRVNLPGLPPVTVLASPGGHLEVAHELLQKFQLHSDRKLEVQVASDVLRSLRYFQSRFGPCPVPSFVVSEIPARGGEAFPGFVQLSWETFQFSSEKGGDQVFRAHEVAHQWWGIGVAHTTYHDQWISEGLAQYAGLLYLRDVLDAEEEYLRTLARWRKQILGARKTLFGRGVPPGPLWLGFRNETYQTRGDFYLVVHKKGAWVFHMLHLLMTEPTTGNDSLFFSFLRNLYLQHLGQRICTADLQRAAEAALGESLDWFFRQWVYDYRHPEYRYAYRIRPQSGGRYILELKFDQRGTGAQFQMPVWVRVELRNGQQVRIRPVVKGPGSRIQLTDLPAPPRRIVMNDLESVLAQFKKVDWEDL